MDRQRGQPSTEVERPRLSDPLRPVIAVVAVLAVMWAVEIIDVLPATPFDSWGVRPRSLRGLFGIPFAPFLHSGFAHLFANTIPFLVLGTFIALGSVTRFVQVTLIVALVSGLGTWLFAAPGTVHIGASGLVFGYLTYLVTRGFFAGRVLWILGGLVVLVFYGGILWGLLPRPGISWTGHVFGAIGGILAAWYVHGREPDDADLVHSP
jgi:membrane associated rhomboid family serine protease